MQERRALPPLTGGVVAGVVVLDQVTKWVALRELDSGRIVDVVGSLQLRLVFNQGMAFGIGSRFTPFVALAAMVVVVVLLRSRQASGGSAVAVAVGLVVGGAVGNLIDRVFRADDGGMLSGAVVDFVDLQWWPVFNVADVAITMGALLLVLVARKDPASEVEVDQIRPDRAGGAG